MNTQTSLQYKIIDAADEIKYHQLNIDSITPNNYKKHLASAPALSSGLRYGMIINDGKSVSLAYHHAGFGARLVELDAFLLKHYDEIIEAPSQKKLRNLLTAHFAKTYHVHLATREPLTQMHQKKWSDLQPTRLHSPCSIMHRHRSGENLTPELKPPAGTDFFTITL